MIRFSDRFRSDEDEGSAASDTAARKDAGFDADAGHDGVEAENETSSRDASGNETHDRTSVATGATDAAATAGADDLTGNSNDASGASGERCGRAQRPAAADGRGERRSWRHDEAMP